MRVLKFTILTCVTMVIVAVSAVGQTIPVGTPAVEDFYRRQQLLGKTDSTISFTVRPVFPSTINYKGPAFSDDLITFQKKLRYASPSYISNDKRLFVSLLPLNVQTQYNTHYPVDWNDGAMIPAKGFQTLMSGGVYLKYGLLSVQFRPEIVFAQNAEFQTLDKDHFDVFFARYYDIYNNIDLPARFGPNTYTKVLPGQSSIRLNYKSLSAGISTENLWWGPGTRNSLLMSNNAPGFLHLTLNTVKPIKTPIGSFEGQIISGKLEDSGFAPLTPDHYYFGANLYVPKPSNWRLLTGMVLTWQPKWVPGLFLGFDRASQMYAKDLSTIGDFFPFFSTFSKSTAPDVAINKKDQLSSMFMRWLWSEEQAEVYFQYGHFNSKPDLTQALLFPDDSRAFIFGLRKMLPFNRLRNETLLIGVELTQMQQSSPEKIAQGKQFYVGQGIKAGYTHMGQALGAGIGPGGNSQTLTVSWLRGLKRIGLQFERYIHNNDFYYYALFDSQDVRRHWVDIGYGASAEWDYKNFIFNARLQGVTSLNYQWYLKQNSGDPYWINGRDASNVQIMAGVTYLF